LQELFSLQVLQFEGVKTWVQRFILLQDFCCGARTLIHLSNDPIAQDSRLEVKTFPLSFSTLLNHTSFGYFLHALLDLDLI